MHSKKEKMSNRIIALRMMKLVRPLAGIMVLAIIMGVGGYLCATFITVFGGYALLHGLGIGAPFTLSFIFGAVIVFAVLRGVLRYAEQYANHHIAFKLLAIIRDKVFRAMRRLAPAKMQTRDKGNLISVITTDIELLEVFYAHTISPIAIAILTSLFMVLFVGSYHIVPALIALAGYLVVGVVIPSVSSHYGGSVGQEYRDKNGELSSTVLGTLRGLDEVMQFGQEKKALLRVESQTHEMEQKQRELKKQEGHTSAVTNTAILVFSVATLFSCIYLYQTGRVGFEGVLIPTIAVFSSFGPVVALSNLSANLVHTFASARRVLGLLDEAPETVEIENGLEVGYDGMACDQVDFAYEAGVPVLEGMSAQVAKNKIVGISGRSGSGKSTLLHLLMRFWDPDKGTVKLSGEDVSTVSTRCLRDTQGLVEQSTQLFNDSIKNNIRIANEKATDEQMVTACKKASAHDFIMTLPDGYDTVVGELGGSLSGGERQRIGLARAFLHDAPMILLDEPTSNLDSLNEGAILQSLQKDAQDKTVVLVSHRASSLGIADEVLQVENGQVRHAK